MWTAVGSTEGIDGAVLAFSFLQRVKQEQLAGLSVKYKETVSSQVA